MPLKFNEAADKERYARRLGDRLTKLEKNIEDLRLQAVGNPEEINPAEPHRVRNLEMLSRVSGEDLTSQLDELVNFISPENFPELDEEDRLFLRRDMLSIFPKGSPFNDETHRNWEQSHFNQEASSRNLVGTFYRIGSDRPFSTIVTIDPGMTSQAHELGPASPNADILRNRLREFTDHILALELKHEDELKDIYRQRRDIPANRPHTSGVQGAKLQPEPA